MHTLHTNDASTPHRKYTKWDYAYKSMVRWTTCRYALVVRVG